MLSNYDLSDVDIVMHSRYDLSYKYFLGMVPEEDVIDHSTLTKFRKWRIKDVELLYMLIGKSVSIAIDKGIIKSNKSHIAMTPERIITAATITSGDRGDGPQLPELVEKSRQNGIEVETVIGDTAYSGDSNLKQAQEGYRIVAKVNPAISQGFRSESEQWEYNKDAGMYICPAGHIATRKARQGKKNQQGNQILTYYFDVEKCKTCALREGCYKAGAKYKT